MFYHCKSNQFGIPEFPLEVDCHSHVLHAADSAQKLPLLTRVRTG